MTKVESVRNIARTCSNTLRRQIRKDPCLRWLPCIQIPQGLCFLLIAGIKCAQKLQNSRQRTALRQFLPLAQAIKVYKHPISDLIELLAAVRGGTSVDDVIALEFLHHPGNGALAVGTDALGELSLGSRLASANEGIQKALGQRWQVVDAAAVVVR